MKSLSRYIIMEEKIQKMIMINHVSRNNGKIYIYVILTILHVIYKAAMQWSQAKLQFNDPFVLSCYVLITLSYLVLSL